MDTTRRLWLGLAALLIAGFGVLLWMGNEIHQQAPPMPSKVVTTQGDVVFTRADIEQGRQVWQSIGGQQLGSIWGHGALVAPDWTADWLHRETMTMLELRARTELGMPYAQADAASQARLQAEVKPELRQNNYDPGTDTVTISVEHAVAISQVASHYESLFSNDPATAALRETYAMKEGTVDSADHRRALSAFFYWTSWAAVTNRPGDIKSYTNNWPYEPLVGNTPTSSSFLWSMFSILFMIAGIGLMGWHYAVWHSKEAPLTPPANDPLARIW